MPLIVDGPTPAHWKSRTAPAPAPSSRVSNGRTGPVRVALINNMPDAALEDTEAQFFGLLEGAAGEVPVHVQLYSLPRVPRGERGERHIREFYRPFAELWQGPLDAAIITGSEPRQPNLRDEPYWKTLGEVFDWAERNTISSVLSCLAAHAGVLHSDGIARHPLPEKQFGVFTFDNASGHHLTASAGAAIRFPHSRWNEIREHDLLACGYDVLTHSAEGGVDVFVKQNIVGQKKRSLVLHFQGHPEYAAETLLKEYRRDIKRFLRGERETYPSLPHGYFNAAGEALMLEFRRTALAQPRAKNNGISTEAMAETMIEAFPDAALAAALRRTWEPSASAIYRNWLRHVIAEKEAKSTLSTVAAATAEAKL